MTTICFPNAASAYYSFGAVGDAPQDNVYLCKTHSTSSCMYCLPTALATNVSAQQGSSQYGKQLVCYIPTNSDAGTVSCVVGKYIEKCTMTTDKSLVTIPVNAIIDSVEYFGTGGFATKDTFSIGLGQLNQGLTLPLIEDATSEIANERNGGCKQFLSYRMDGRNDRCIVLYASNVNVVFNQPVTVGGLMIVIYYHMKPI